MWVTPARNQTLACFLSAGDRLRIGVSAEKKFRVRERVYPSTSPNEIAMKQKKRERTE